MGPILFFAPVKRTPLETIIQKATELGVSKFSPVLTERCVVSKINSERLAAIALEAAEQCGRLSIPSVDEPMPFADLFADWPAGRRLMYCDEAGDDPNAEWGGGEGRAAPALEALSASNSNANEWGILIGPEGGFSPAERDALRARKSVLPVTLGPRILRADTATIAALALFQAVQGDWRGGQKA
ncbi:MAG: RsmE family RNA methyltransferase [Pseudomonadota bacterium]